MIECAPANFYDSLKRTWGVIDFDIVGDTTLALRMGIALALQEHSSFTHYREVENEDGSNELHFIWYCPTPKPDVKELPFPLKDADAIATFIGSWIQEKGKFSTSGFSGGDGSDVHGFRLTNRDEREWRLRTDHLTLRVCPTLVYYGK